VWANAVSNQKSYQSSGVIKDEAMSTSTRKQSKQNTKGTVKENQIKRDTIPSNHYAFEMEP
jgi:hypothetical protein